MGALYYSPLPTLLRPLLAIVFGLAAAGTFLNFAYCTATDFTPRYYDKPFDLQQLESVDLLSSYGAGEASAPLLLRCDVGGQDYVALSIETRKERPADYSSSKGFFKQYELTYVVAAAREVIRLRTTYRQPPEAVEL
jgi:Domain of unknown function (DUF4105)